MRTELQSELKLKDDDYVKNLRAAASDVDFTLQYMEEQTQALINGVPPLLIFLLLCVSAMNLFSDCVDYSSYYNYYDHHYDCYCDFLICINQSSDYRSYCFFDVMLLPTTAQSIGDSLRRLRPHLCSSAMSC
jgi:hypothetical protein